jgi:hypothetical protein
MSENAPEDNNNQNGSELPVLTINLDSLPSLHQMFGSMIERDKTKYMKYLNADPLKKEDFRQIVNLVLEVDHKQKFEQEGGSACDSSQICGGLGIDGVNDMVAFILCHHYAMRVVDDPEQTGGFGALSLIGMNPFDSLIPGFGSSYKRYICKQSDADAIRNIMSQTPEMPNPASILKNLVPESYIENAEKAGLSGTEFIEKTSEMLDNISLALRVFDTTEGNIWERGGKAVGQVALSSVLAVVTLGAGGDNILALPTAMAKGMNMMVKLFNKLGKILIKIQKMIPAIQKGLSISTAALESVGDATKKGTALITELKDGKSERIEDIRHQMRFFYNLFTVDFRAGPGGVRCWVEYIFQAYMGSGISEEDLMIAYESGDPDALQKLEMRNIEKIKSVLCLMNEIYSEINKILLSFIGSALDSAIPDSLGLFGILFEPIFSNFSNKVYSEVRNNAEQKWDGVFEIIKKKDEHLGVLLKNGFENPSEMVFVGDYLFAKLSQKSFGLSDQLLSLLPDGAYDKVDYVSETIGHLINKGVTYMFLFINIFAVLSEIDTGYQAKYTSQDIKGILANQCPAYLKAVTALAKKGYNISKDVRSVDDAKRVGTELRTKAVDSGKRQVKKRAAKERDKILDRAHELDRTADERAAAKQKKKQEEIDEEFDIKKLKEKRNRKMLVERENQNRKMFNSILTNHETIMNAILDTQFEFDLEDDYMDRLIDEMREAALQSQKNLSRPSESVMLQSMEKVLKDHHSFMSES